MSSFRFGKLIGLGVTLALAAVPFPAFAQLGDRGGNEVQRPPSADLEVPPAPVLSPNEALQTFVLPPHFRIELIAAEPLVHDPVMITFDSRGRLWVAELSAYNITEITTKLPVYLEKDKPPPPRPPGRIVVLEDTNGDGRMDKRTVYADNLNVPRAIGFYKDQVLIGDPPHLWVTRDRDGDGVMDEKTLLDDAFGTPENVEGSPNGLLWGHDNWLYNASYRWRWRPDDKGQWCREPIPSVGQWGLTQDDFGRRFYSSNSDQLRGDLIPSHYAGAVDPRLPLYGVRFQVATDQSTWPVRPNPGVNRGYTANQLKDDGTLNTFTAASAPLVYRGTNFPANFAGNAFVPGPDGNLVKRNLLLEREGRLTAVNAYINAEFLTSTDERFRPVFLANAPDGTLYVVDFYRGMLEGYEFITTYLRDQILKRGLNTPLFGMGRIYRVVYENGPQSQLPDFARADAAALIKLLTDENGWARDTAHRRIVDSGSPAMAPALRELFARAPNPRDRMSALWCLEGLVSLAESDIERALNDSDSRVRSAAVQAAAPLLKTPAGAKLLSLLAAKVPVEEPIVLAIVALSLAGAESPAALELLWALLPRGAEHPVLADGVIIALHGRQLEALRRLQARIAAERHLTFGSQSLLEKLAMHMVVAGGGAEEALIGAITNQQLPQLGRIALMRGATGVPGVSLSAGALARLGSSAPDGWVRRRATEATAAATQRRTGRGTGAPLSKEQQALFEAGRTTYGLCAACHQPDGLGRPDLAPPFRGGRWTNMISPDSAIRITLHGKQGTPGFAAPMVPLPGLTDEQLAGVLTFVRRSFGNSASAVSPTDIARVRSESKNRIAPWTDEELARGSPAP